MALLGKCWSGVIAGIRRTGVLFHTIFQKSGRIWNRIPFLRSWKFNFILMHYTFIISFTMIGSIILYPGRNIAYIDSIFFCAGAATQSGLNTVNFNKLFTYQQVWLYITSMFCNPIAINSFVVFVRLYWFEKRFQHIANDARALRWTRSRNATIGSLHSEDDRAERGVRGRSIVVLRNEAGEAHPSPDEAVKLDTGSNSESGSSSAKQQSHQDSHIAGPKANSKKQTRDASDAADPNSRLPIHLNTEHHIAFLEHQRADTGTLIIPSPREYDRGGKPRAVAEGERDKSPDHVAQGVQDTSKVGENMEDVEAAETAGHIVINEPSVLRIRTATFPRVDSRRTANRNDGGEEDSAIVRSVSRRSRPLNGIFRSLTEERERDTAPYLSWNATVGRNSVFLALTEEQREELGGIEYRALKTLAAVLTCYFVFFHLLGVVCLTPWIMTTRFGSIVTSANQGRVWWGIFTSQSAFNDVGFTLTSDSMISFYDAVFPLLLMAFLIVIGNTGFPCMLRFTIWVLSKVVTTGSPIWEEFRFLLDHPRRCFTLLFPRNATWWLFGILIILNGLDLIFFIVLDLNDPTVTAIPPGLRFLDGLFQAVSTRTAGFGVVNIAALHPAIQVSYLIMMYISVFPIAISMRRTNVYEEKSLGIYGTPEEEEEDSKEPSYIGAHLRKQLSFDLWYVFLGFFVISIVEGDRLQDPDEAAFTLFAVLFEIVSAYGTVGLSLGYPTTDASFSSQFRPLSKLVMISMQVRGRHRGLPYALDRAILLPSESLNKKESSDAERRMRRRGSNLSNISAMTSSHLPPDRPRPENGLIRSRTSR